MGNRADPGANGCSRRREGFGAATVGVNSARAASVRRPLESIRRGRLRRGDRWSQFGAGGFGAADVGFGTDVAAAGEVPGPVPGAYTGANVFVGGSEGAAELAADPAGAVAGADVPATPCDAPPGAPGAPGALGEAAADAPGEAAPGALGEVAALDAAAPGTPGDWGSAPAALGACDGLVTPDEVVTPGDEAMAPGVCGAAPAGASGPAGARSACRPTTAGIPFAACKVSRARSQWIAAVSLPTALSNCCDSNSRFGSVV